MSELTIAKREVSDRVILDLSGDITYGDGSLKLRNEIRRLVDDGRSVIWLNLEKVGYVDSSGIGEFISGLIAVNRIENGQLRLLNPTDRLIKLLEISHLLNIFDTQVESRSIAG